MIILIYINDFIKKKKNLDLNKLNQIFNYIN